MATLKEQLEEKKKLRDRASAALKDAKYRAKQQGLASTPAIGIAEKTFKEADAEVKRLTTEINKKETEKKTKKDVASGNYTPTLPFQVDDKIMNEIKNLGISISPEAFNVGGVGAGIFVYQGDVPTKVGIRGGQVTVKKPKVELANTVINSYWDDKTIQNKVMSALIAAGKSNATQLDGFATWQSVVQQSANLYNAGRGPKFTPMDILNMSITKAGGKPDVTTYIDMPKDAELKEKLKTFVFNLIQKEPKDDDPILNQIFNEVKNLYSKGVTTTTTVDAKTGRKTVKQTGGVSNDLIQAKIEKAYKNSADFLEAKSLEATDYFTSWMRS